MVSITTKRIKGNEYLYLVDSIRHGDKVIQKSVKYIGKKRPIPKAEFECMKYSYSRQDWILKSFNDELSYQDHEAMKKVSSEYKKYILGLDKVSKEKERERFLSVFISNSNAIEGSTLTPKDTFDLLFNDITPSGHTKKEIHMALNLLEAWNFLEKSQPTFPTTKDLFTLHRLVNKNIEGASTLGRFKPVQNFVGNEITSSYLFTDERMRELFGWIKKAFRKVDDFEVAFQSHAQFEIIHPFVDGNGRVGRLLLNWLLMFKGYTSLAIPVTARSDYLYSLNIARKGNLRAICLFMLKTYLQQYEFK